MKIVVFAYDLVVAGVTVNAIELAAALRDLHGHEVVLFAGPGPMIKLAEAKGLRYLPAPPAHLRVHPSPARISALRDVIRSERPDLIHVWEWVQYLDAYYVEYLLMGVPMIVTDMSMKLQRILPKALPTTFGTPEVRDQARAAGHRQNDVILPPVDVHLNAPGAVDPQAFRDRYGIENSDITLVTVSRLDRYMKGESLYRTLDAVSTLGASLPLRLVIVGDGDEHANLRRLADITNVKLGRSAVVLTGALVDPRPAYAAADIVIGMGGSALRGMAFGKPVLVVGEQGFCAPFSPVTSESFLYRGIYGLGDGDPSNARLAANIRSLVLRDDALRALGDYSRAFVEAHFSLEVVSARLSAFCEGAV
ncbi:MAG: glycosyltransferase family 4 protein, partial [Gammaproteobacteria bacterium]